VSNVKNILVTGGSGFIGSNFIRYIFNKREFTGKIVNLDSLTYSGNPLNLSDIADRYGDERYSFVHGNITDYNQVKEVLTKYEIETVVHFAAESHVDRSILGPSVFIKTNINGTFNLLEAVREVWKGDYVGKLFHHVSTDEVYGSLGETGYFFEDSPYDPRSPYSASKASSDHLVNSYFHTYGLPITISNCSNNYGPYQFPEKLIPLIIENILSGKELPVYGDGGNIRDWLFVDDHNEAVWKIITEGKIGETYNVGGENEWKNIDLVHALCEKIAVIHGQEESYYKKLISFVTDRPGHDRRYAINCDKIKQQLGWKQSVSFSEGLDQTIKWYLDNRSWVDSIQSGDYRKWVEDNYLNR